MRTCCEIIHEMREAGEVVVHLDPGRGEVSLVTRAGAIFAVGDDLDASGEIDGWTWATYTDGAALIERDYCEHDGGTTEEELRDAVARARGLR